MSGDLIDTTEMYLKSVFELEEEGVVPMRARIAERLDHSGPTVSQTVARMERDGLIQLEEDRHLTLTPEGRRIATEVMRKHRLAERLLTDHIGLEFPYVHEEACRWEHVISEAVERKIATLIKAPFVDPYGNPIPGLEALGIEGEYSPGVSGDMHRLSDLLGKGKDVKQFAGTLLRIGEPLQTDVDLLTDFAEAELLPGASVEVTSGPRGVKLVGEAGMPVHITLADASHLIVRV
ncbi:metal-dependent transcriptional regulator [Dermabacteraceae bacterium P13088]